MVNFDELAKHSEVLGAQSSSFGPVDDGFVGEMDSKGNVRIVPVKESKNKVDYRTFKAKALKY